MFCLQVSEVSSFATTFREYFHVDQGKTENFTNGTESMKIECSVDITSLTA